ncbi:MAG: hypothetical protein ACPG3V_07770 [Porticoccaceae bacterium]
MDEEKYLGYIKYVGRDVEDGLLDARKAADALIGFDKCLRFFMIQQIPSLKGIDFEIPVRIRKGSWEVLIPETVGQVIGAYMTAYSIQAIVKMASNDIGDKGTKEILLKAIDFLKGTLCIGKHMGNLAIKKFNDVQFTDNNALVGVRNDKGEILYVSKEMLEIYVKCDPTLFTELASIVTQDRKLVIGSIDEGKSEEEELSYEHKNIFFADVEGVDEQVILPELIHGNQVVLDGEVTRENKTSNSMGFLYEGHILTAYPESKNIVPYKPLLFLKCRLYGVVIRLDDKDGTTARRPKLLFSRLEPLEQIELSKQNGTSGDLFNDL